MAYYNPSAQQSYRDPALSQYPVGQMVVLPQTVVQPQYPVQLTFGSYASGYSRITSVCVGVLQIFLSWVSVTAAALALGYEATGANLGTGLWCAAVYQIAGIFNITAGVKPTNGLITASTVLSLFVFPFGLIQLVLSICGFYQNVTCYPTKCYTVHPCAVGANATMINVGSFEVVFGLSMFIVGCYACCCSSKSQVNDVTAGMVPSVPIAVTSAQATQNYYTANRNTSEEMPNHHLQQTQAGAPKYSYSNGKRWDLDLI